MATQNKTEDNARNQAEAQLESIKSMMFRLKHAQECDGDDCELTNEEINDGMGYVSSHIVTDADIADFHNEEDAQTAINEDPLSIETRSNWHSIGEESEDAEFQILLCTGGPAVRIMGELDNGTPRRAWLEYQDWGTSWTFYVTMGEDNKALLAYAQYLVSI